MSFTVGHMAAVKSPPPALVQARALSGSTTGPATSGGAATLGAAASPGSLLLSIVKANGTISDHQMPTGFTDQLHTKNAGTGAGYRVYAKVAAGGETAVTPTFANNMTNIRSCLLEVIRLAPPASVLYSGGIGTEASATGTAFNPAAATTDTPNTLYLCVLAASAGLGTVGTPWTGGVTDIAASTGDLQVGILSVAAGESLDTNIGWTNSRGWVGDVLPLRGVA